ncbi:hypothetical protein EBS02_05300 [bacterium]|nr:hypothetical protein [bacterium]
MEYKKENRRLSDFGWKKSNLIHKMNLLKLMKSKCSEEEKQSIDAKIEKIKKEIKKIEEIEEEAKKTKPKYLPYALMSEEKRRNRKIAAKKYYDKIMRDPEKRSEYLKKRYLYFEKNKEIIRQQDKERRRKKRIERDKLGLKPADAESRKRYYEKNKEKFKAYAKKYYLKNKEKYQAYAKEYAIKNKEKRQAYIKEYAIKNREKLRAYHKDYSQASYTPKLDEDNEVQFPEFASLLRQRLEKFFKQEDIRATLTSLIDNLMCSGYGVIKMNYKRKNLSSELIKEYQICLDPVFYPEMAFFSPFAKTATKTDDFYSLPNNFCGIIHKVDRELIKEKYKKQLKGNYPQSIGVMQEQAPFLHALMTDNRNLVFIAEYFNYTKEGKVERTLFCQNCVLEHTIYNWDFLPIIYVDGNSSYVSDIQQVYSLFDKALNVQKRMNFTTSRIIELTPFAKTSTFAFINKFTLDEQFITDVHDVSNSNYIIMQQAPHGLTEQDPPILLPAVELPQTLLASREQDIMFLDQMMRGYYDSNDSRFGESGRALELKQQSKSNLFAIQLGNLSNGLKKFSEFYIKMFYGVHRNNITDQSYELLQSFDTFESYCIATDSISFDIIVDPNVSLTKEVNRRALAEAMQYIPEPMIREILIKDYVRNMPVSDPSSLLREITQAMIKQQEMQEKQANEPTELEKIQTLQNQSNEKIAEQRNQVTLEQHREDNLTKLLKIRKTAQCTRVNPYKLTERVLCPESKKIIFKPRGDLKKTIKARYSNLEKN